jgi:hypothetical protein
MTKLYHLFNKPDVSSSINVAEQNIPEIIKPTNDKLHQRSQKLITKLRQIKINSIPSNQGEQKSNNERKISDEQQNKLSIMSKNSLTASMNGRPISQSQSDLGSISDEEAKLTVCLII